MTSHVSFGAIFRGAMFVVVGAILSSAGITTSHWQLYVVLFCMGMVQLSAQLEVTK